MNIVYLKYAVTVAKAGSLTKAAEELFVAQPNLSRAIKELEKDLGLFQGPEIVLRPTHAARTADCGNFWEKYEQKRGCLPQCRHPLS